MFWGSQEITNIKLVLFLYFSMSAITKFLIAVIIPTIIFCLWATWSTSCFFIRNESGSREGCNIPVGSVFDVPFIAFILYFSFYVLSVFISEYRITKKKK